jgi:hypothetical protein
MGQTIPEEPRDKPDEPPDADVEKAWDAEILRRLSQIDAGTARLVDRPEFGKRLRARSSVLGRRRG